MTDVNGLFYVRDWLSRSEHEDVAAAIDREPWRGDLARRTQHYGYVYDYKARTVNRSAFLGPLPDFLQSLAARLVSDGMMPAAADQAIVNEYEPGQGIADHIDCTPCFDGTIVSLSLRSSVVMTLKRGNEEAPILLEPGSLLVLRDEARYAWTHGIAKRKADTWNGVKFPRARRVSVTFRKVILEGEQPRDMQQGQPALTGRANERSQS